jgi:hypothetical protein
MGQQQTTQKCNFEDIQILIKNSNKVNNFNRVQINQSFISSLIINTLPSNEQGCLISGTINYNNEEQIINEALKNKYTIKIIIYGKNSNDETIYTKYKQLLNLGFTEIYLYLGGLFEWLCLQDIYGQEEFPTTSLELDILKYKPISQIKNNYYITN